MKRDWVCGRGCFKGENRRVRVERRSRFGNSERVAKLTDADYRKAYLAYLAHTSFL